MALPLSWGGRLGGVREQQRVRLQRSKQLETVKLSGGKLESESRSEGRISAKGNCGRVVCIKDYPRMPKMASIRLGGLVPGAHPDPPLVSFQTLKGLSSTT